MESYLVRIYRKEDNNPRLLIGVVEETGRNEKKAFNNIHELWDILNPVEQSGPVPQKERNRRKTKNNRKFTNL